MNSKTIMTGIIVYSLIGITIGLYAYYSNVSVHSFYFSVSSAIDSARQIIRGIGAVALILAVYEYVAFEIRSGLAATLLSIGLGIRGYIGLRVLYLTGLAASLFIPMILIGIPLQDYRIVIGGEAASDAALIIGVGVLLSVVTQRIAIVVLGTLMASLGLKLAISLLGASKSYWIAVFSSPYLYYLWHTGSIPNYSLAISFFTSSVLFSVILLLSLFFLAIRVARRGVHSWRP